MIDIRELQKRGVVRLPKKEIEMPTNNDGFIELGSSASDNQQATIETKPQSNSDFFGFMDTTTSETPKHRNAETPNEHARLTDLDNKIYKLEQRIELLEKKLEVNQPNNNVGAMGW